MAGFDIANGLNKAFLASVGAVAITAEKSQEVIEEFVKKGELTVQQGKDLNAELTRKVKETFDTTVSSASDAALRAKLEVMTPEERAAYAAKVAEVAAQIEADKVKVEVEVEGDSEPADDDAEAVEAEETE